MRLVSPSFCTLLTLLALTGCAKDSSDDGGEDTSSQVVSDQDKDGFTVEDGDCNDEDATVNPDATDNAGDGVDQNCDEVDGVDADGDGSADAGKADADGDGIADVADPEASGGTDTDGDGVIDQYDDLCKTTYSDFQ